MIEVENNEPLTIESSLSRRSPFFIHVSAKDGSDYDDENSATEVPVDCSSYSRSRSLQYEVIIVLVLKLLASHTQKLIVSWIAYFYMASKKNRIKTLKVVKNTTL